MTKTIFYAKKDNIRKGADIFIQQGNIIKLSETLAALPDNNVIVVAEDTSDHFLKGLVEEYGIKVVSAEAVPDGLTKAEENEVSKYKDYDFAVTQIHAETGFEYIDIAKSKAFAGESRIEKNLK